MNYHKRKKEHNSCFMLRSFSSVLYRSSLPVEWCPGEGGDYPWRAGAGGFLPPGRAHQGLHRTCRGRQGCLPGNSNAACYSSRRLIIWSVSPPLHIFHLSVVRLSVPVQLKITTIVSIVLKEAENVMIATHSKNNNGPLLLIGGSGEPIREPWTFPEAPCESLLLSLLWSIIH